MLALHYPDWNRLEIADIPDPIAMDDEVVVRVAACGICGSELETYASRSPRRTPPLVMGHEFCGIVESGRADGFPAGSRIVCNAIVHCGQCVNCLAGRTTLCDRRQVFGMHRPGALAQLVAVPASCLLKWPEGLPAAWAGLAEPLGNGVHVVERIRSRNPETVLILGAGSIGLMVLQAVCALLGVPTAVVDVDENRLETARRLGAAETSVSTPESVDTMSRELTAGRGFDVVVDAAGNEITKSLSVSSCTDDGVIVWIGLGADEIRMPTYPITLREMTVTGSYGASARDMETALELMTEGRVDLESWVTSYPLEESVEAFQKQLDSSRRDIKAVISIEA
jgi:threonine dehydrogenase-like Zn-dependent dehydrogenase